MVYQWRPMRRGAGVLVIAAMLASGCGNSTPAQGPTPNPPAAPSDDLNDSGWAALIAWFATIGTSALETALTEAPMAPLANMRWRPRDIVRPSLDGLILSDYSYYC